MNSMWGNIFEPINYSSAQNKLTQRKKSRIREAKNLSTDADSRTDTILERLRDLSKKKKIKK